MALFLFAVVEDLDQSLEAKNCKRYKHVKKQTVATVNYFDVTKLYTEGDVHSIELLNYRLNTPSKKGHFKSQKIVDGCVIYLICNLL